MRHFIANALFTQMGLNKNKSKSPLNQAQTTPLFEAKKRPIEVTKICSLRNLFK